jgi:phosphoglycolate phosphatase-like HAD superfamily hydrolase
MGDALPSWNDGATKASILDFIQSVTTSTNGYVAPTERIATFDNDGTLWCEKPMYVQADFIFRRWKEMVQADSSKASEQPYKALVEGDRAWLGAIEQHIPELLKGLAEGFGGITTAEFETRAQGFFGEARHPTLGRTYTQLGYVPMRELLDLLRANEFRVFICTGGGRDFVRLVSEEMYGVPRENVIGSGTTLEYRDGAVYRAMSVEQPIDDGPGKPVHIWMRTGRMPLLAAGNSDGDAAMLGTARFRLLVHHDDATREFAYDTGTEHALEAAKAQGWTVVSMKNDWSTVFA